MSKLITLKQNNQSKLLEQNHFTIFRFTLIVFMFKDWKIRTVNGNMFFGWLKTNIKEYSPLSNIRPTYTQPIKITSQQFQDNTCTILIVYRTTNNFNIFCLALHAYVLLPELLLSVKVVFLNSVPQKQVFVNL